MSLEKKYILSQAPISTKSPLVRSAFLKFIEFIKQEKVVYYKSTIALSKNAKNEDELLKAEDEIRKISLYLWLSYKFPDIFVDVEKATNYKILINKFIENSLKMGIKRTIQRVDNTRETRNNKNKSFDKRRVPREKRTF
jgi:ATP-dependent RNA helicase SUPV3L1/SUV3